MASPIGMIVGLGNPGPQYELTRHNAGFWFVEAIAQRKGASFRHEQKFHGEVCRVTVEGHDVWLLKPLTFMNRSGQAVAALARFYKIPPQAILVAHDELDFAPGTLRLKEGGGHGGHNGLRDIIAQLGKDFLRLRIGIGHPGESRDVTGFVLGKAPESEQRLIEESIDDALTALPLLAEGELQKAMNLLHSRGKK